MCRSAVIARIPLLDITGTKRIIKSQVQSSDILWQLPAHQACIYRAIVSHMKIGKMNPSNLIQWYASYVSVLF